MLFSLKQCITFPLKDKSGNIVSLYGRRITQAKAYTAEVGKHYYSENRKGLYPAYPNANTETLIITEAIIDAASLLQCIDALPCVSILSAYGTNGLTTEHTEAVSQLKNLQEVIFFFDGDQAGQKGAAKYSEELAKQGVKTSIVCTPPNEDVNSLWVNYGKEAILQLIEERILSTGSLINQSSFSSIEKSSIEKEIKVQTQNFASQQLNTNTPNKIIYETKTARYIIKGSLPKTFDRMEVSLDAQDLETGLKYRCRCMNIF